MPTLLEDVYSCRACVTAGKRFATAFATCQDGCPKKFPPTIGAKGTAKLLFMALSPRLSPNYVLDWCMNGPAEFSTLAGNRDQYSRDYLKSYNAADNKPEETFYRPYIEIAAAAFSGKSFEEVAAVSDLYLCAYPAKRQNEYDPDYIRLPTKSPCADIFLERIVAQVRPIAIISKGNQPMHYFRKLIGCVPQYRTAYPIQIDSVQTTILPVEWAALNGTAREPEKGWLVDRIREADTDTN